MRVFYVLSNWIIFLTSPLWVLPVLLVLSFQDGAFKSKLLKGDGSLV